MVETLLIPNICGSVSLFDFAVRSSRFLFFIFFNMKNICKIHHDAKHDTSATFSQRIGHGRLKLNSRTFKGFVIHDDVVLRVAQIQCVSMVAYSYCNGLKNMHFCQEICLSWQTHALEHLLKRGKSLLRSKHQINTSFLCILPDMLVKRGVISPS